MDGFQNRIWGNKKLQKMKDLADKMEVHVVAINEQGRMGTLSTIPDCGSRLGPLLFCGM